MAVEKTVNENRDRVALGDLSRIESAIAEARQAARGDDAAAITRAVDQLQKASHGLAEQLYKGTQSAQGSQGSQDSNVKDAEIVDAEYAETK